MTATNPTSDDHSQWRLERGRARREQTRLRLVEAALNVFATVGSEGATIDQIVAVSNVSRGSFYNHFKTIAELEAAVAVHLSVELSNQILVAYADLQDPAARIAIAMRYFLERVSTNPRWGWVIVRTGLTGSLGSIIRKNLLADLMPGLLSGRMTAANPAVAMDLIIGTSLVAMQTILSGSAGENHAEEVVVMVLSALGIPATEAARLATEGLLPLEPC